MLNLESIRPKEMEAIYIVIIIINAIHKANEALDKTQKNKRKEWWTFDIETFIEHKKRIYNKCLMIKNVEDREHYKRDNRIVKERIKKKKIKCGVKM